MANIEYRARTGMALVILLIGFLWTGNGAHAQSSANYSIQKFVVAQGGEASSSANYSLQDCSGQPSPVGPMSSANYGVYSGYWGGTMSGTSPAVMIQTFTATYHDHGVELAWDIFADETIDGFNIYRGIRGEQTSERVNVDRLIPPDQRRYTDNAAGGGFSRWYVLGVVKEDGSEIFSQSVSVRAKRLDLILHQNYPNPFNPSTTIQFSIDQNVPVKLSVYDVSGKLVRTLVNRPLVAGTYTESWNGRDTQENDVASGIYFYRMTAPGFDQTRKMLLLK